MSADVVGYSRLMGADEAGTLAAMQAHRRELWDPVITAHGGRVVGTAGDSLLIEYASAVAAVEAAIAVQRGMVSRNADLPEEGRLSPRDPSAGIWQILYNMGLYGAERYDGVVRGADEAIRTNPDFAGLYRQRAAALAKLGREEEARDDIKQVLRLDPGNTIKTMRETPFWQDIESLLDGLRRAGLPEE
ncbi:MAG: hypothetical protein QGF20_10935 [Alphaproteobacteria bacterium]|nr:hypothetical protein [Alphaproteobacteria bacterium]